MMGVFPVTCDSVITQALDLILTFYIVTNQNTSSEEFRINDAYLYDCTALKLQSTSAAILWANKDRTCFCGDDQTYHPMKKKH